MSKIFEYSVAIRTLGLAGEKFVTELKSLHAQTILPKKIVVYIAEGYDIPKTHVGMEEYVYVPKGMVAQRALDYKEIDTDYLLVLDDDIYLPPDSIQKMSQALLERHADLISFDIFQDYRKPFIKKAYAFITNMAYPRKNDGWAFKIQRNASFSYNNNPDDICWTESAAGAGALLKLNSFKAIHLEDEKWLDKMGFAYGEDLLFYNKLFKNGYKLLIHYGIQAIHLDASSSRKDYSKMKNKLMLRAKIWFILWHRICYNLSTNTRKDKVLDICSFSIKLLLGFFVHLGYSIIKINPKLLWLFIKGNYEGYKFVHSKEYKAIPNFIVK